MNNSLYLDLCVVRSLQDVNKPQITTLNHVEYQRYITQGTITKPTSEQLNDDKQILQSSGSYVGKKIAVSNILKSDISFSFQNKTQTFHTLL